MSSPSESAAWRGPGPYRTFISAMNMFHQVLASDGGLFGVSAVVVVVVGAAVVVGARVVVVVGARVVVVVGARVVVVVSRATTVVAVSPATATDTCALAHFGGSPMSQIE